MACPSLFFYCMLFALYSSGAAFTRNTEPLENNSDWKLAMKKIKELQMIVKFQEASLENRCKESVDKVTELERSLKKQFVLITQLEARVDKFKTMLKIENDTIAKHAPPVS